MRTAPAVGRERLDLLDPHEIARLGGIEVVTEGIVEGFLSGLHRSPRRGFSVEFAEHRAYQPGDEPRYVDWKLLARTDRLYVKQYEEETNLRAMLVLDTSRSMAWTGAPGERLTKLAYARLLTAALALVLLRQRDATGLITFDDEVRRILPPRARRGHWYQLLAALQGTEAGRGTAAEPALRRVVDQLRRRGLVVFISDLLLDRDLALEGAPLPGPSRTPGAGAPPDGSGRAAPLRRGRGAIPGSRDRAVGHPPPAGLGRRVRPHRPGEPRGLAARASAATASRTRW